MIAANAISQAAATESAFDRAREEAAADCERRLYNKLLGISIGRASEGKEEEEETSMKEAA